MGGEGEKEDKRGQIQEKTGKEAGIEDGIESNTKEVENVEEKGDKEESDETCFITFLFVTFFLHIFNLFCVTFNAIFNACFFPSLFLDLPSFVFFLSLSSLLSRNSNLARLDQVPILLLLFLPHQLKGACPALFSPFSGLLQPPC